MNFATDSLPLQIESTDTLRQGLSAGLKHDATYAHPVEKIQQQDPLQSKQEKIEQIRNVYGAGSAARLVIEEEILSRPTRLPGGLPSSRLGYAALTGKLDDFTIGDYVGLQVDSEVQQPDLHSQMEARLKMAGTKVQTRGVF